MTVQAWLDSEHDYEVGRQLYEQLGESERLKQNFSHGPTNYNREALLWELQKLARVGVGTVIATRQATAPAPIAENVTEASQPEPPGVPAEAPLLLELLAARRPLYDERTHLHAQLEVLAEHASQEDVRLAAARIMQLSRQVNASRKTEAYVRVHGQLPPPPPAAPGLDTLSPVELLKKRNSLRSQVSKLKKRPDRADDLAAAQALLEQVQGLLNPTAE